MQIIRTKYFGPTDHRGSRIKATTSSGIIKYSEYDCGASRDENHMRAARLLKEKLNWVEEMTGGDTKSGMVFVSSDGPKI